MSSPHQKKQCLRSWQLKALPHPYFGQSGQISPSYSQLIKREKPSVWTCEVTAPLLYEFECTNWHVRHDTTQKSHTSLEECTVSTRVNDVVENEIIPYPSPKLGWMEIWSQVTRKHTALPDWVWSELGVDWVLTFKFRAFSRRFCPK